MSSSESLLGLRRPTKPLLQQCNYAKKPSRKRNHTNPQLNPNEKVRTLADGDDGGAGGGSAKARYGVISGLLPDPAPSSLQGVRCGIIHLCLFGSFLRLLLIRVFGSFLRLILICILEDTTGVGACAPSMLTNHLDLVSAYRIHTFASDSRFGDTRGVGACAP
jgi:hypothetical protein